MLFWKSTSPVKQPWTGFQEKAEEIQIFDGKQMISFVAGSSSLQVI
jgi:hypothetical protein